MKRLIVLLALVSFTAQAQLYKFMASPVPATSTGGFSDFGRNLGTAFARWDSVLARYGIFTSHGSFGGNLTVGGTLSIDSIITALRLTSNLTVDGYTSSDSVSSRYVGEWLDDVAFVLAGWSGGTTLTLGDGVITSNTPFADASGTNSFLGNLGIGGYVDVDTVTSAVGQTVVDDSLQVAKRLHVVGNAQVDTLFLASRTIALRDSAMILFGERDSIKTNSVAKRARFAIPQYLTANRPFVFIHPQSISTGNFLSLGGGTSFGTAANEIRMYTTPLGDVSTQTGTIRVTVDDVNGRARMTLSPATTGGSGAGRLYIDSLYFVTSLAIDANRNAYLAAITGTGDASFGGRVLTDSISNPLTALVVPDSMDVTGSFTAGGNSAITHKFTSSTAPSLYIYRVSNSATASIAASFRANNAASSEVEYGRIGGEIMANTTGIQSGGLLFGTVLAGTHAFKWRMDSTGNWMPLTTGAYDIGRFNAEVDSFYVQDESVSGFSNFSGTNTGTATLGAGDSIQVTLTGFTSSGIVVATYKSNTALTTSEIPLAIGNKQTNKFTIFGSNGEAVDYWIAKK